ncbi:sulfotransferase [Salinivibrio sp. VYel4]|uniref:sulfotransferase n=1 Tax=Salinivibrio sp. VYel4 TaxID=2490491 RepID=UPI00128D6244|nr:sulfotransferase [Salinivibrio sp. VYel4]MPY01343.1 hypothetical protein [Salinivibrio sp. VYel4]
MNIYIGGTGRCGTNVLKDILIGFEKSCGLPFESRFTVDPGGVYDSYQKLCFSWTPFNSGQVIRDLESLLDRTSKKTYLDEIFIALEKNFSKNKFNFRKYKEWELEHYFWNYGVECKRLIDSLSGITYQGVWPGRTFIRNRTNRVNVMNSDELKSSFSAFLDSLISCYKRDNEYYIDDNTFNICYASTIRQLQPNSKIIHMYRDPRDVVSSYLTQRWTPNSVESACDFYSSIMSHWYETKDSLGNDSVHECSLEELCEDRHSFMLKLHEYIGADYCAKRREVVERFNLSKSNVGRWKTDLSPANQEVVQNNLQFFIDKLGYA